MLSHLDRPTSSFASDNTAGAHPAVLDALVSASEGPAVAYGADPWTARASARIGEVFDADVDVFFTYGGTGANVVGLASVTQPWEAVICPSNAHVFTDECGAFERLTGSKLLPVDCPDGKLDPTAIAPLLQFRGDEHHVQPRIVSITQSTEFGTLYTNAEIGAIAEVAHDHDLLLHVDGARLSNAVAALGNDPVASIRDTGVDILSFGGTKNGLVYGEAVVFFGGVDVSAVPFVRKQSAQLPSKVRFIAAQFEALLTEGLWMRLGDHANACARRLGEKADAIDGVRLSQRPEVNAVFAHLPRPVIELLEDWSFFYRWDDDPTSEEDTAEVRWMTNFTTTEADVDRFAAGIRAATEAQ